MKQYPKYKDSGIEWIGEIPEGWGVKRLKYTDFIMMGQSPRSEDYNELHYGVPFLQGNSDFTEVFPKPRIYCHTANKIVNEGDILISVRAPIVK